MSRLMEQAFRGQQLPESDQEAIASIILQEIEAEKRWEELFARPESADLLSRMADEALAGIGRAGRGSSTSASYELLPATPVLGPVPDLARVGPPAGPASLPLFQQDPHHPSLRFRQVHPTRPIFSARVGLHYRAVGIRQGNDIGGSGSARTRITITC